MSEPKFTPGPWSYHSDYIWSWKSLDKGVNPRPIAGPANLPSEHEENKANAHLIAAAPDLFYVVGAFVSWLNDNDEISLMELGEDAKAALAKARGESHD